MPESEGDMAALIFLANGLKVPIPYWVLGFCVPALLAILAIIAELRSWKP